MRKIYLLLVVFALVGNLFSYSLLDKDDGNMVNNPDARLGAMGGAGTGGSTNLMGTLLNPANLSTLEERAGVQFTAGVMKNDDDRSLAMYDFFDGYVGDATYASNTNFYDEYSIAGYYSNKMNELNFAAAISYNPFLDFNVNYEEEVRNDANSDGNSYPHVLAYNLIEGEGTVNALGYTLAATFQNKYSLGLYFAMLSGDNDYSNEIHWTEYAHQEVKPNFILTDSISTENIEYEGSMIKFGAQYKLNERVNFGFSFQPEIELDATSELDSITTEYTHNLPSQLRAGVVYMPRNIARTYFNMDVEIVDWESISSAYDKTINYYIGVEHKFQYGVPLRFGFRYVTEYRAQAGEYAEKITSPTFTAGSGFKLMNNLMLDLSFEFTNREYEDMDLFMDSFYEDQDPNEESGLWINISPEDRTAPDTVSENLMKVQTSLTYKW